MLRPFLDTSVLLAAAGSGGAPGALACVTASEYGHKSPGYEEAKKILNV